MLTFIALRRYIRQMSNHGPFEFRFPSAVRPFLQCFTYPINNTQNLVTYKPTTSATYFQLVQNLSVTNTSAHDIFCFTSFPSTTSEPLSFVIRANDTLQIVSSESPWHVTGIDIVRMRFAYKDSTASNTSTTYVNVVTTGLTVTEDVV